MKMKIAVIFGVAQMLLGIFLKSLNAVYNNDFLEYLFEFWPQFILMWCWFGYMSLLIIYKWLIFYTDTSIAPSIIASMIDMFLKFGAVEKEPILSDRSTSESIQVALLIVSFLCIPLMLLVRPIHSMMTQGKHELPDTSLHGVETIAHTNTLKGRKDGFHQFVDEEDLADRDDIDKEINREEQKIQYNKFVLPNPENKSKTLGQDTEGDGNDELEESMIRRRKTAKQLEDKDSHDLSMVQLRK